MPFKKRSLFKITDPIVRKDVYSSLVALWALWMVAQSLFLLYYSLLMTYDDWLLGGTNFYLIVGFITFSCIVFLSALLVIAHILNKITGPIYRISTDIEGVLNSEKKDPIKLREGDYFQKLASDINILIEKTNK